MKIPSVVGFSVASSKQVRTLLSHSKNPGSNPGVTIARYLKLTF